MKKEYEPPEIEIEYFDITSSVCTPSQGGYLGWEETDRHY